MRGREGEGIGGRREKKKSLQITTPSPMPTPCQMGLRDYITWPSYNPHSQIIPHSPTPWRPRFITTQQYFEHSMAQSWWGVGYRAIPLKGTTSNMLNPSSAAQCPLKGHTGMASCVDSKGAASCATRHFCTLGPGGAARGGWGAGRQGDRSARGCPSRAEQADPAWCGSKERGLALLHQRID